MEEGYLPTQGEDLDPDTAARLHIWTISPCKKSTLDAIENDELPLRYGVAGDTGYIYVYGSAMAPKLYFDEHARRVSSEEIPEVWVHKPDVFLQIKDQ